MSLLRDVSPEAGDVLQPAGLGPLTRSEGHQVSHQPRVFATLLSQQRQWLIERSRSHERALVTAARDKASLLIDEWQRRLHAADCQYDDAQLPLTRRDESAGVDASTALWAPWLQHQLWQLASERALVPRADEAGHLARLAFEASLLTTGERTTVASQTATEEHLRRVIDMTEVGWFDWYIESDRVEMSEQMCRQWEIKKIGPIAHAIDRIHPEDRAHVDELVRRAIEKDEAYVTQYRLLLSDGSIRWIDARGRVFYANDGRPLHFVGTSTDITKAKENEQQQVNDRQWLEMVLARLPIPVVMVEPSTGEHTFANGAASAMLGHTLDTQGRGNDHGTIYDVRDASGRRLGHTEMPSFRSANGELLQNFEVTWRTQNAAYDLLFSSTSIPPLYGRDGVVVCLTQDVTPLKVHQRFLQNHLEQARRERKRFEQHLAIMMHDVRTPLSAASLAAQLARRQASKDAESVQKNLSRIETNLQRIDDMLRRLLDDKGAEHGSAWPIQKQPAALGRVLEEGVRELNTMHHNRVRFHNALGEAQLDCDEQALRRVLDNLVNNAVKYGHSKTPISVKVTGSRGRVSLQVHNEGAPISPADQAALFAPYFRAEQAEKSDAPGWGLGLSGVHDIARAHGGNVCLTSSAQHGTTFDVTFPAAEFIG